MNWWQRAPASPEGAGSESAGEFEKAVDGPSRADFDVWLEDMDFRLMRYREILTPPLFTADYSRTSIAALCEELLRRYPQGTAAFADDSDLDFLDGSIRYIGQTLIRHYGGKWVLDDQKDSMFFGLPVVVLDAAGGWPLSPRHLITATVLRRTPVALEVYDAQQQHYANTHGTEAAREAASGSGRSEHVHPTAPTAWAAGALQRAEAWAADASGEFVADFSAASLPGLSAFVSERIPDLAALDDPRNEGFVLGAVAYLGETMRRAAGGTWAHGPGERDPEGSPVAGVPFLTRDNGPDLIGGHPYWGIYDLVDGDSDSAIRAFQRYVHPHDA